jgi:dTDP-4-amino-4,6-dideoxygalactose transaminase
MVRLVGLEDRVQLPVDVPGHIYNQFVIRAESRDALQAHLRTCGVETEVYYPVPLHLQECFQSLGHHTGDFVHAEAAALQSLALPIYPEVTAAQQSHVVNSIAAFYQVAATNLITDASASSRPEHSI